MLHATNAKKKPQMKKQIAAAIVTAQALVLLALPSLAQQTPG